MKSATSFKKTALCAVICSLFLLTPPMLAVTIANSDAAKAFIGTWNSSRTRVCGPCILKIEGFNADEPFGTLTSDVFGTTALKGKLVSEKGKVVLRIFTPGGNQVDFDYPADNGRMLGTFAVGGELAFKRQ